MPKCDHNWNCFLYLTPLMRSIFSTFTVGMDIYGSRSTKLLLSGFSNDRKHRTVLTEGKRQVNGFQKLARLHGKQSTPKSRRIWSRSVFNLKGHQWYLSGTSHKGRTMYDLRTSLNFQMKVCSLHYCIY